MDIATPYIRLSRKDNLADSLSPEVQLRLISDYCRYKGWTVGKVYQDLGVSGGLPLGKRPQGKLMVDSLAAGNGIVICARQDRLFRNSEDAIVTINDWRRRNILPVLLAEGLDLSTPAGRLMFLVMAGMGQYEREITSERTLLIIGEKQSRNERVSRTHRYGWTDGPDGKPVRDPKEDYILRKMKNLRSRGHSDYAIAADLNNSSLTGKAGGKWYPSTVKQILDREGAKKPNGEKRASQIAQDRSGEAKAELDTPQNPELQHEPGGTE